MPKQESMLKGCCLPEDRVGRSQVLPAHGPALIGSVASRIKTVATISLSATGSKKAPKGVDVPCMILFIAEVITLCVAVRCS